MTVEQLIKKLGEVDPGANVVLEGEREGICFCAREVVDDDNGAFRSRSVSAIGLRLCSAPAAVVLGDLDLLRRILDHQKQVGHNPGEIARCLAGLTDRAHRAAMYARIVEDLDDVATHGPRGGR